MELLERARDLVVSLFLNIFLLYKYILMMID